jgi:tetratricopeptide (TPR) repeat protein
MKPQETHPDQAEAGWSTGAAGPTQSNGGMSTGSRPWLLALLLVAVTLAAYQPIWHAGFIWDDDDFITNNPVIKSADGLSKLWFSISTPDYYPMTYSLWWLEWRLWGDHPLGYHLINVLLHAFSAVLLWRVLLRLKIPGALLAAAIFALHPVNVESAAWIAEGKNTLSMLFYATTLLCWLKYDDGVGKGWYGAALAAFAASLLSKTGGSPLPVVLLGIAWWRRGRVGWPDVLRVIPFFALAAILGVVTVWFTAHQGGGHIVVRTDGFWARLAGAGWAIWFYLYKTIFPINLITIYLRWHIDAGNPLAYIPLLSLIFGLIATWKLSKPAFFALAYFIVLVLPVVGFINIAFMRYSLVADRWQYFAIIGPIAAAAVVLIRAPKVAAVVLLVLGALTWHQCGIYRNAETLWAATVQKNPDAWVAQYNLALELSKQGRSDDAIPHFQKAAELHPELADAHNNLGRIFSQQGRANDAIAEYQKALAVNPDDENTHYNLGLIFLQQGWFDSAAAQFQSATALNPRYDKAFVNWGIALAKLGRNHEAITEYRHALAIAPDNPYAHNALAHSLEAGNKWPDAAAHYSCALAFKPDLPGTRDNLNAALAHLNIQPLPGSDPMQLMDQAVGLAPDDSSIREARAVIAHDSVKK